MLILVSEEQLQPWKTLADYEQQHQELEALAGAAVVFVGSMRDYNQGDDVKALLLEHYEGMTEKYLENIAQQAKQKWQLLDVLIMHRVGEILPRQSIVLVATWSAHRAASYEANRWLMEELKSKAPFWKKETLADDSTRWVESNTSG